MKPEAVKAMTDEERQIKVAELLGWTAVARCPYAAEMQAGQCRPLIYGFAPGVCHFSRNWEEVPDHQNDIAAAWPLTQAIPKGYSLTIRPGVMVILNRWEFVQTSPDLKVNMSDEVARFVGENDAQNITMAFVSAAGGDDE